MILCPKYGHYNLMAAPSATPHFPKDGLLPCKRPSLGMQYAVFCTVKGRILETCWISTLCRPATLCAGKRCLTHIKNMQNGRF